MKVRLCIERLVISGLAPGQAGPALLADIESALAAMLDPADLAMLRARAVPGRRAQIVLPVTGSGRRPGLRIAQAIRDALLAPETGR